MSSNFINANQQCSDEAKNKQLEICGRAQCQAARRHKHDCLGPRLLIRQAVDYKCGKMPPSKTPQRILLKFGLNSS